MPAVTRLLAVDTSAGRGSVALLDGGRVLTDYSDEVRSHTRRLEPMINGLLARAGLSLGDLDALAYGAGPGSFTGLRVTAGLVQGLAFGLRLPVVPVSSLQAMAYAAHERLTAPLTVAVARDARMGELYWGLYRVTPAGSLEVEVADSLVPPTALALPSASGDAIGVGDGWLLRDRMPEAVVSGMTRIIPEIIPEASAIAHLAAARYERGEWVGAEAVQPVYLRDDVAWQTGP